MRLTPAVLLLPLALTACGAPETTPTTLPPPSPQKVPVSSPTPAPESIPVSSPSIEPTPGPRPTITPWWNRQGYQSDWSATQPGQQPPDLVTAQQEGYSYPFLYDAGWQIRQVDGGNVLSATASSSAYEPLSFLRYAGKAFGPDGALPNRYRVEAVACSLGGANRYHGYGELAIQAFYVDPRHYVEVVQNDVQLSIWEADGAEPNDSAGWTMLAQYSHPVNTGDWVRFGAAVDLSQGTITLLVDGQPAAEATSSLLTGSTGKFAIRATGNQQEWRSLAVSRLP